MESVAARRILLLFPMLPIHPIYDPLNGSTVVKQSNMRSKELHSTLEPSRDAARK